MKKLRGKWKTGGYHARILVCGLAIAGGRYSALAESGSADNLQTQIANVQQEVEDAVQTLRQVRDDIDSERIPLLAAYRAQRDHVLELRRRLQYLQDADRLEDQERRRLESETKRLEEQARFVLTALSEYRRGLETRMPVALRQAFEGKLNRMDMALRGAVVTSGANVAKVVLEEAVALNQQRLPGLRFSGSALDASGTERQGDYLAIGPLVYFRDLTGGAGIVTPTQGSLLPSVFEGHSTRERQAVSALIEGNTSVSIPVDVSGGAALKRERASATFLQQVRQGGFVMIPLLVTAVVAILISLKKIIEFRRLARTTTEPLDDVLACVMETQWAKAHEAAQQLSEPLSRLVDEGLEHRSAAREHIEEILHERLQLLSPSWENHLGTLAVLGGIAPLLGLLGTVTGMIHTFELVTLFGTGDARLLSGGISEALITTKFGLGIAIPVLVAHAFLVRRLRVIVNTLEGSLGRLVHALVYQQEKLRS